MEKKRKLHWVAKTLLVIVGLFALLIAGLAIFPPEGLKQEMAKQEARRTTPAGIIEDATPSECAYYYDSVAHEAHLIWSPKDAWDEDQLVQDHLSRAVDFGRAVFAKIPNLERIVVQTKFDMTDVNGNTENKPIATHAFKRGDFMQVKWDVFEHRPFFLQVGNSVDGEGYIHPGIIKKLDIKWLTDKMYYSPKG